MNLELITKVLLFNYMRNTTTSKGRQRGKSQRSHPSPFVPLDSSRWSWRRSLLPPARRKLLHCFGLNFPLFINRGMFVGCFQPWRLSHPTHLQSEEVCVLCKIVEVWCLDSPSCLDISHSLTSSNCSELLTIYVSILIYERGTCLSLIWVHSFVVILSL